MIDSDFSELGTRLDRLERNVDRLMTMLEQRTRAASVDLISTVTDELGSAEDRLSAALLEISEPDVLGPLTHIATLAPELVPILEQLAAAPTEQIARAGRLLKLATLPETSAALEALLEHLPQLTAALIGSQNALGLLARASQVALDLVARGTPRIGWLGALGALREPTIQSGVGFVLGALRELGLLLEQPLRQLPGRVR
ncbi:MAG: DUF1641 domain-containing protein [Polyangiales bacterium]